MLAILMYHANTTWYPKVLQRTSVCGLSVKKCCLWSTKPEFLHVFFYLGNSA